MTDFWNLIVNNQMSIVFIDIYPKEHKVNKDKMVN